MRVLVTGGTGYVGTHAVVALLGAGHDVKLLVRAPERVSSALAPLGIERMTEAVAGDVTEPETVERALAGCDAVIHAASVFTLDARKSDLMRRVNVAGTETVLSAAVRRGLDPVVHVSSELSLLPPHGRVLGPDAPVSPPPERYAYSHTKGMSELVARRFQQEGLPHRQRDARGVVGPGRPASGRGSAARDEHLETADPGGHDGWDADRGRPRPRPGARRSDRARSRSSQLPPRRALPVPA